MISPSQAELDVNTTSNPTAPPRARRGTALVLTLIAVVVLAALSTGAMLGSMQEFRGGRNSLVEQRAFAVAEFGLNQEISAWKRSRNLPPPVGMAYGAIDSTSVFVAQGDTARVKVTRLNENTFWVVSIGRANIGNSQLESQRQTHMLVRIAYPTINPGGAIVTAGEVDVKGSAEVHGENTNPAGGRSARTSQAATLLRFHMDLESSSTSRSLNWSQVVCRLTRRPPTPTPMCGSERKAGRASSQVPTRRFPAARTARSQPVRRRRATTALRTIGASHCAQGLT